jgi:hypothetical protein
MTMKNAAFWDVTACCCKNRRFGEAFRLHHQGDKNWPAKTLAVTSNRSSCEATFFRNVSSYKGHTVSHSRLRQSSLGEEKNILQRHQVKYYE